MKAGWVNRKADKEAYEISKRKKSDSMKAAWARRKAAKMGEKLAEAAD
jgi:hypothetical protein